MPDEAGRVATEYAGSKTHAQSTCAFAGSRLARRRCSASAWGERGWVCSRLWVLLTDSMETGSGGRTRNPQRWPEGREGANRWEGALSGPLITRLVFRLAELL